MMKKRTKVLFTVLLLMFFLVGFGKKQIELLDDKKLIDLAKAIEYAKPGGDLEQKDDVSTESSDSENNQNDKTKKTNVENLEEGEKVIVISIRNQSITYAGQSVESAEKLEEYIRRANGKNVHFTLVDDWAEAHRYKEVKKMVKSLHDEIGIIYSIE